MAATTIKVEETDSGLKFRETPSISLSFLQRLEVSAHGRRRLRIAGALVLLIIASVAICLFALGRISSVNVADILGNVVGIAPALMHVSSGRVRKQPWPCWARYSWACLCFVITTIVAAIPWVVPHDDLPAVTKSARVGHTVNLGMFLVLLIPCSLADHPPSGHIRLSLRCVFAFWLRSLSWGLCFGLFMLHVRGYPTLHLFVFVNSWSRPFESVVIFLWAESLVVRRLAAFGDESTTVKVAPYVCAAAVVAFNGLCLLDPDCICKHVLAAFCISGWLCFVGLMTSSMYNIVAMLRKEKAEVQGLPAVEAAWAVKVVTLELVASFFLALTTTLSWYGVITRPMFLWDHYSEYGMRDCITRCLGLAANAYAIALLSGLFWQFQSPKLARATTNWLATTCTCSAWCSNTSGSTECSDFSDSVDFEVTHQTTEGKHQWESTVEELAGRGVQLKDLLAFWKFLLSKPEVMPEFDPNHNTTNDVVWQAIIPLTRDLESGGGVAMASKWSDGKPVMAERMVTHNWSNLFLHLVAAIVADGLNQDCFNDTAVSLSTLDGVAKLEDELASNNALSITYWVCAFSVNQHASICGGDSREPPAPGTVEREEWDSKRCDTVTGMPLPVCTCSQEKLSNQDAACEMDKFQGVMRRLTQALGDRFSQLVVVDRHFEVFHRVWCLAEMVEADRSGLEQRIQLFSRDSLDLHYRSLAALDVRDCKASRPDDREMLLAGIPDIEQFNMNLQVAIFGSKGLFSKWVDGQERSLIVGRIIRRLSGQSINPEEQDVTDVV